jgi:hypothetical protein
MGKLVICTGSDSNLFYLAKGLVLSLRRVLPLYDAELAFFDLGCTQQELAWLQAYSVDVIKPKDDFGIANAEGFKSYMFGQTCRPMLPGYLPGRSTYLWLDADTWVMPGAGNAFEQFEPGWLWMFPDTSKIGPKWDFLKPFDQRLADESGFPLMPMRCHNSGVVLFDWKHAGAWMPPARLGTWWVSEQYLIARRAAEWGFLRDFPPEMNTQWYWPDFAARESDAKILHLAACPHGERISRLKLYARRYGGDFV